MSNLITNKTFQALTSQISVKVNIHKYYGMACNLGDNKVKKEGKKKKSKHTDTDMKRRKKKPLP